MKAVINLHKFYKKEYSSHKVLKQLRILNSNLVIDIGGRDNPCFVYTGSGCRHVLCRMKYVSAQILYH